MRKMALLAAGALFIGFASHAQGPAKDEKKPPSKVVGGKDVRAKVPTKSSGTCDRRVCQIAVTAGSCQAIDVNPDELRLKGHRQYEIVWTIPEATPATFRDKGIFFKPEKSAPLKVLGITKPISVSKDSKEVRMTIEPGTGRWYYGVQLAYGKQRCPDYDPVIINEM